jgi:NADH:ubiquinone oxidoreductase subunit 5 (subunit L)/multisubunit Na+/H+ antiporter MnhA subunit
MIPSHLALLLVPVLPLLAALAGYALRSLRPRTVAWMGCGSLVASALLAGQLLGLGQSISYTSPWFTLPDGEQFLVSTSTPGLVIPFQLNATVAQLLFLLTTALIAAVVLAYAAREREGDAQSRQFFATLTLFAGSMLLFIASDTLLVLYLAWELMGVCSYLLISHPATAEARRAARQAFWTTRATDTGLLFAVLILMMRFKWATVSSIDVHGALQILQDQGIDSAIFMKVVGTVAVLLLLACVGKAAQLPLSFWLPDAMVAPAPVSALLHAATMVAAGPFLLIRFTDLFQTVTTPVIGQTLFIQQLPLLAAVLVGGLTLVLGGMMALCAREPKRVLAYSTVSQLGMVVMSVGALSEQAGLYHLLAHAWFKAALFLAVGYIVINTASTGNDGEHQGATLDSLAGKVRNPIVRWTLLLAGLSLAGVWPLAGALGKEQVLHGLLHRAGSAPAEGVVLGAQCHLAAAGWFIGVALFLIALPLTAAYITRLVYILCFAQTGTASTASDMDHASGANCGLLPGWKPALWLSLALAAAGSLVWALAFPFFRAGAADATKGWEWGQTFSGAGMLELLLSQALVWSTVVVVWNVLAQRKGVPGFVAKIGAARWLPGWARYFREGMYLREVFTSAIGRTGTLFATLAGRTEVNVIDWLAMRCGVVGRLLAALARWTDDYIVDGVRKLVCGCVWLCKHLHARYLQTGNVQHYIFIILLAAVLLCFAALKPLSVRLIQLVGSR